jgi:hypothetical protein
LTALISGTKNFYVSADGNLLLAGDPNGFDIEVGVKATSGTASNSLFTGTYYTTALENDRSGLIGVSDNVDSYYGSVRATGVTTSIEHLRDVTFQYPAIDYTSDLSFNFGSDGTYFDSLFENMLGVNGQAVVEVATGNFYSLTLGLQAKPVDAAAVYGSVPDKRGIGRNSRKREWPPRGAQLCQLDADQRADSFRDRLGSEREFRDFSSYQRQREIELSDPLPD